MQLPSLNEDGSVSFTGPDMIEASWSAYVSRGALAVKPVRKLAPLEQLEVYLVGGGIKTPIPVKVEVVHLGPEHALLRMLDTPPPMPALEKPTAAADDAELPAIVAKPPQAAAGSPSTSQQGAALPIAVPPPDPAEPATGGTPSPIASVPPSAPGAAPALSAAAPALQPPNPWAQRELVPPTPGETAKPPPTDDLALANLIVQAVPPAARTGELDGSLLMPSPDGSMPPPIAKPAPPPVVTPAPPPVVVTPAAPEPVREEKAAPAVVYGEREAAPIVLEPIAPEPVEVTSPELQAPPKTSESAQAGPPKSVEDPQFAPKSQAPAVMPPFFTGDALRFMGQPDYEAALKDLTKVGAVLAVCDGRLPSANVDIKLMVAERETRGKTKVMCSPASPGTAVVQCIERGGFLPLIAELERSPTVGSPPPKTNTGVIPLHEIQQTNPQGAAPAAKGFTLPRSGVVTNPTTAEGILAMPLMRAPTEAELDKPSVPLLLRWLRTTRGCMRLEVQAPDHPVFTMVLVDGREIRSSAALSSLGRSLAAPQMTYTIIDLPRPPQMSHTGRTLHLISETVRALCTLLPTEELAGAFPKYAGKCARAITDVVQGLGLPQQHQRFVKTDVDGSQFVDEIARAAVGQRTVWETLYLLELYNGLSWDEPAEGKKARAGNSSGVHKMPYVNSDDAFAAFEGKDHFQILGLHWSSSPTEVQPAYQKLKGEYGPGGQKRPTDQTAADKIVKRIDEAYRVLNDAAQRRLYRREKYNLQWAHQAQLLVQKAKLSIYRKDYQDATNILLAAEDMSPSEEAKQLLAQIKAKLNAAKP